MSCAAGLVSRKGENVTTLVAEMLGRISPARADVFGVATPEASEMFHSSPVFPTTESSVALGYKLIKVTPLDDPQPLQSGDAAVLLKGRGEGVNPLRLLEADPLDEMRTLQRLDAVHIAAAATEQKITLSRDPVGTEPLYLGINSDYVGFASNTKTLKRLNMRVSALEPGCIADLSREGVKVVEKHTLTTPSTEPWSIDQSVEALGSALREAVEAMSEGIHEPTVAFSGGVDSVVTAALLKEAGASPSLICVGVEGSRDFEAAEEAAEALSLPLEEYAHTEADLEEDLDALLACVEDPDPVKLAIAAPLYWVAERSMSRVVFTGGGSDELLGGYAKYAGAYRASESEARNAMLRDLAASPEVNYERDAKTCINRGVELRMPFTSRAVVNVGLRIPTQQKITGDPEAPRKIALRLLAAQLGVPENIATRPKKAAQYSSGAQRALESLAKRRGLKPAGLLAARLRELEAASPE